jgi:hypothetical protein
MMDQSVIDLLDYNLLIELIGNGDILANQYHQINVIVFHHFIKNINAIYLNYIQLQRVKKIRQGQALPLFFLIN